MVRLAIYADDIQVLIVGPAARVVAWMVAVLSKLLEALEQVLMFVVNGVTSVIAAGTHEQGEEVVHELGRLQTARQVKNLGVDFARGRRSTKAASKAMAKAATRVPRLQGLRNAGAEAWKIGRTVIAPAMDYRLSV